MSAVFALLLLLATMAEADKPNKLALDWINYYRSLHGARTVVGDAGLTYAAYVAAKSQCDYLGKGRLNHGVSAEAGRSSLFRFTHHSGFTDDKGAMSVKAIQRWYKEASVYCRNGYYNHPPNSIGEASSMYGHFSSIVWKSVRKVGVWAFKCTKSNDWIVAYTQDPRANVIGAWKNNMGRPSNC